MGEMKIGIAVVVVVVAAAALTGVSGSTSAAAGPGMSRHSAAASGVAARRGAPQTSATAATIQTDPLDIDKQVIATDHMTSSGVRIIWTWTQSVGDRRY